MNNFNITGNGNEFYWPKNIDWFALATTTVTGRGNKLSGNTLGSGVIQPNLPSMAYGGRDAFGPFSLSRSHFAFDRTAAFLQKGATAYYFNDDDLWIAPLDADDGSPGVTTIADANPTPKSSFR